MDPEYWRKLGYRWFVEYNPLYVASAALVLVGVTLLSRGLTHGAALIAEIYAWGLIGGATLLMRLGLRRPAVMLALLAVVYQGDVTLHMETSVYLGLGGLVATVLWLGSFVAKLFALGRAMRLRLSPSAIGVPVLGALGLVTIPRVYPALHAPDQAKLLALFSFGLFAAALWTPRLVRSVVPLDAWGETVLRRSLRATWLVWALLALVHAELWSVELDLSGQVLVPVVGLLATRFVRRELGVWLLAAGTLVFVGLWLPSMFAVTAAMAAMALCLRALRGPRWIEPAPRAEPGSAPYRTPSDPSPPPPAASTVVFALASAGAQVRLATGAIAAVYLACWTATWSGGAWPLHVLALDLAFFAACALLYVRFRARSAALPVATSALHAGVQTGLITAPVTELGWGLAAVSLGFVLLAASLATAVRLRRSALAPSPPS